MFILRETFTALRRTPLMSAMTAFILAIALAVIGVFGVLIIRAHDALAAFRSNLLIEAFFDPKLSTAEAQSASEQLRSLSGIRSFIFISKESALEEYQKQSGENLIAALGYNPLPASAQLTMNDLTSQRAREIESIIASAQGVVKVALDHKMLEELEDRQKGLITLATGIGGLLLAASLIIVAATIRLGMHARRDAMLTMRLLGASRTSVVSPFIFEGLIAGLIGSVLGIALAHAIVSYGLPMLMPDMKVTFTMRQEYVVLAGAIALLGILLTALGSSVTALLLVRPEKRR